ncbi:uncharacterized protein DUF4835 [Balneicella halophila]|uniref:Uncharacterized protein DUF4835 n=1 Tax=Balneicella halophila TaxID=1537566 RepID=A0A7L4UTK5_BALHA|nr:DUF4835 family protein [Balneicella halophila]PVX52534.1 uncharacterized protein DUF4835 [Balneicella halophila]
MSRSSYIKIFLILQSFNFLTPSIGQELDCDVKVITQKVTGVDHVVFKTLEQNLSDILNATKWTDNKNNAKEKIACTFLLIIEGVPNENSYQASVQVQASRPVFNSSYITPLLNHKDKQITFSYLPNEAFHYEGVGKNKELVAVAAYYAYLILGLDGDSFSRLGGTSYFKKALDISVQQGQGLSNDGWSTSEREINRYWMVEDLLNYKELRESIYNYHREGLDKMVTEPREAIENMLESIKDLAKVHQKSSDVAAMHMFFDAKANEITQSTLVLPPEKRKEMYDLLGTIDPGHLGIYKVLE